MNKDQTNIDDKILLIKIKEQLEKSDEERFEGNWKEANELLLQALAELGGRYYHPSSGTDDTGLKLIAANNQDKEGKLENAVRMRRRILSSRLDALRRKIGQETIVEMDDKALYAMVNAQLEKTDVAIKAQNWKMADELLKQALSELVYRYHSNIRDDTYVKNEVAYKLEEEGKLKEAILERQGVLAILLEILRKK